MTLKKYQKIRKIGKMTLFGPRFLQKKWTTNHQKFMTQDQKNQHSPKVAPIEKLANFAGGKSKNHFKSL